MDFQYSKHTLRSIMDAQNEKQRLAVSWRGTCELLRYKKEQNKRFAILCTTNQTYY